MNKTKIIDTGKEIFTRYGTEEGCAGCRINTGSTSCENCIEEILKDGGVVGIKYHSFQSAIDYHKKPD